MAKSDKICKPLRVLKLYLRTRTAETEQGVKSDNQLVTGHSLKFKLAKKPPIFPREQQ